MERLCQKTNAGDEIGYLGVDLSWTVVFPVKDGSCIREVFLPEKISFFGGLFYRSLGLVYETELDKEYY